MDRHQIFFNSMKTYDDLGLIVLDRKISTPSKIKIKETVPFMNGSYDFSNLYGTNCYPERTLEYTFKLKSANIIGLEFFKTRIINWVNNTNSKEKLEETFLPGYYYMAECSNIDFEEFYTLGKLKVIFNAYPFKIAEKEEGNNLWDDFNFELDILQDTKFEFSGTKDVVLHNLGGKEVVPEIICDSDFEIIKNNITYKIKSGTTKDSVFTLDIGANNLVLKGNGKIEFKFRKELL